MKTKQCSRCKDTKPTTDFCKCSRMKDGFQPACKTCMNDSYNRSRKKNQHHYQEVSKARRHKLIKLFDQWKDTQRCWTCGEDDPDAFDLHHLDPTEKDVNISDVSYSWAWERLLTELNKCVVLCSKCHRKHHNGRLTLLTKS